MLRKSFLLCGLIWVLPFLPGMIYGQHLIFQENFDDGNLTSAPIWQLYDEAAQCFSLDSVSYLSPPYSLRVSTKNQRASIQSVTGIASASTPFVIQINVMVANMGDEAIPLFLKGNSLVLFLFLLPDGRVQLTVLKEKNGWNPVNLDIQNGYQLRQWHSFRIEYDGNEQIMLLIDNTVKGTIRQPLVDVPSSILIGNPSLRHTSTFYIDDIQIFGPEYSKQSGKIYLILCSDTGTWNGLNMFRKANYFGYELFSDPTSNSFRVMNKAFREQFRDSEGNPLVLTWFMLVGSIMAYDQNPDVQFPWISNLEMMKRYHEEAIHELGDELSFHYHNWVWNDPDGDGRYLWNQSVNFDEYRDNFIETIGHLIVEGKLLPSSFRSGWHYMDNQWECLLDGMIPYRLENASPAVHTDETQPLDNIYDWSRATQEWVPYHPDSLDYQISGGLRGWESRCKYMKLDLNTILSIFSSAVQGKDLVVTFWSHLPEKDFPQQIAALDSLLHLAANYYPQVSWEYCTATEAMQKWRRTEDNRPPQIHHQLLSEDEIVKLILNVDEPLWQPEPLCFGKLSSGTVQQLHPDKIGNGSWELSWPATNARFMEIGIGVSDTAGNAAVSVIPLMPSGVVTANPAPENFRLLPCYPNPASTQFVLAFQLPEALAIDIEVFNLRGQRVQRIFSDPLPQGLHHISLQTGGMSSGIYFVRIRAGRFSGVRKVLIQK